MTVTVDLVEEYGVLSRLEGFSPHARGQRFNGLIADVLRRWAIPATENVRGAGEIDVTFTIDGQRFILEAKWEQAPTATGAIAKLQKRVRQRLRGTIGVFISMAGYTPEAIADVKDGEQLEVVLLDKPHFEAMLSGFPPPAELLNLLVDWASYKGDAYVPLPSLLSDEAPVEFYAKALTPDERASYIVNWFRGPRPTVEKVFSGFPYGQSGLSASNSSELLVTTSQGVFSLDVENERLRVITRIRDCSGKAVVRPEGVYVVRHGGVALVDGPSVRPVAGGTGSGAVLIEAADGRLHILFNSYGGSMERPGPPCLQSLPSALGDQVERRELNYPPQSAMNAAFLSNKDILVVGSGGVRVDRGESFQGIGFNGANVMGLHADGANDFACVADTAHVSLFKLDTEVLGSWELGQFNLTGSVSYLAANQHGYFFMSHTSVSIGQPEPVILWLRVDAPTVTSGVV